ncbi:tyrosine-protein phosphatase [Desulfoferrobacter suflitae]|uniref:tyrosine-protein phosphatase n=1 Tax=Desulfoferrobacter suflitae TaxID=2865782 RepID=UPI00216472EA|nr:CpsB/CapC family capsule biosynthesis tyrosine phosphatase [Desulfoferrobacter suflitae]MCK8603381.1 hypothetical protein [Desulfoferrobacter suflitae]
MLDLHSHILPGLDDGAADWRESLAMARSAADDGIRGMVCTPHWMIGVYDNTRPIVFEQVAALRRKLQNHGIPLTLYPGSELRLDASLLQRIRRREILTVNDGGRYALIELPEAIMSERLEMFLWDMIVHGITPVIAHPERNAFVQQHPEKLANWIRMGIMTQITAASLLGLFGSRTLEFTRMMLEHRLVHIMATDSHGLHTRPPILSRAAERLEEIVGKDEAQRMTMVTPHRIVSGQPFSVASPRPLQRRASLWKKFLVNIGMEHKT